MRKNDYIAKHILKKTCMVEKYHFISYNIPRPRGWNFNMGQKMKKFSSLDASRKLNINDRIIKPSNIDPPSTVDNFTPKSYN